jgi:pimeloyl-ACP methyl ester carboxylesterase
MATRAGETHARSVIRSALLLTAVLTLVPLGGAAPTLPLLPCTLAGGVAARCGTFTVLEDRAAPPGRTISLRVAVIPARDGGTKADPLVHITGGPGGSAVADALWILSVFSEVNESRDIVLVDQRGTGGSNRLDCPQPRSGLDFTKPTVVRTYTADCMARLAADPRQYTTKPAMADLADVLRALGYRQVNVYGASYGATAAQYFLAEHGELVRTVILDGATLVDVPIFELWGRNGQRALRSILDRCARSKQCRARYPRVRRETFEVIAALRRRPVRFGSREYRSTLLRRLRSYSRSLARRPAPRRSRGSPTGHDSATGSFSFVSFVGAPCPPARAR